MGLKKVLSLRVRLDVIKMVMKGYSIRPRDTEMKPQH